jgi:tryptophanase
MPSNAAATQLFLSRLRVHAENSSPETLKEVCRYFSSEHKFADYAIPSDTFILDLLSDSGTSKLTEEQVELAKAYKDEVPSIQLFAYARSTPREHLDIFLRRIFGSQLNFYPTLQGRASEKMLLQAILLTGLLEPGNKLVSNRPFDTTKGHIEGAGLQVHTVTPQACPKRYTMRRATSSWATSRRRFSWTSSIQVKCCW